MIKWLSNLINRLTPEYLHYKKASLKNRFPCRVEGAKYLFDTKETIVLYKVGAKKDPYQIKLQELIDDPLLVEKFHPTQAVKLGFAAFGEIIFNLPEDERAAKYESIMKKMFTQ